MTKKWFLLILVPFFVFAFNRIGTKHLMGYHHFRQAHTAMTARNFASHDMSILRPTIDGVTYDKDLYINECPLYPYIVGLFWKTTGEHLLTARLLSLLFAVFALWYYARLLDMLIGDRLITGVAVFAMSISPVMAYFARSVQRQSLFMFCLLAGIFYVIRYLRDSRARDLALAAAGLSLAILLNPFVVYIAIPLGWFAFDKERSRLFRRWPLLPAAILAAVPAAAWYAYSLTVSRGLETGGMLAITDPVSHRDFLSPSHYAMWLEPKNWERMFRMFTRYVIPPLSSFLLVLFGIYKAREPHYRFFKVWLIAVLAYFVLDFYPIAIVVHHYYYMNVAPLTSLFFAVAVVTLGRSIWKHLDGRLEAGDAGHRIAWLRPGSRVTLGAAVLGLCVLLFACESYTRAWSMASDTWHWQYYKLQHPLKRMVPRDARVTVIAESNDPLFSYILSPVMTHRLVHYSPETLDALLEKADFEYLLLLYDRFAFPLDGVVRTIDSAGYLGEPVLRAPGALLYGKAAEREAVPLPGAEALPLP